MGNPKGNVHPLLLTDAVTLLKGVGKMTDIYLQNIHKHAEDEHISFPEGLPRYVKTGLSVEPMLAFHSRY